MNVDFPIDLEYSIQTRQKADLLVSTTVPQGVAASYASPIRRVLGYSQVCILAVADQPFDIQVFQAADLKRNGSGNFAMTPSAFSAVVAGMQWLVCQRVPPCGAFMKLTLRNTGPGAMGELALTVLGLPC